MNRKIKQKILRIAHDLYEVPIGQNKHFAFLLQRNKILSIGFNNYDKSHPTSKNFSPENHESDRVHAELDCLMKVRWNENISLNKCTLVVIRLMRRGGVGMSKPCPKCQRFIDSMDVGQVVYSDADGKLVKEK